MENNNFDIGYQGELNGKKLILREPILDDLPAIEVQMRLLGLSLERMDEVPRMELMMLLLSRLCIGYGDNAGITREELGKLPLKSVSELTEAMSFFRDVFPV